MNSFRFACRTAASGLVLTLFAGMALADPAILPGTVTAPAGDKLGGVTVSAKAAGSTITTTVFSDEDGNYYFPSLPAGKYRVWAQALPFETAAGEVDLKPGGRQDFALSKIEDTERLIRQMPGDLILA